MATSKTNDSDLRKQFLQLLNQPELCEQFYLYMKSEHLAYVLEFYLACDGLKNLLDDTSKQDSIIKLIYKHYLSNGKHLSSLSSKTKFSLPDDLIASIKQRLIKHEFHIKFYDQAQEYVLKYMLQMCYPKFLIEQQQKEKNEAQRRVVISSPKFSPMHRKSMLSRKKDLFEQLKQKTNQRNLK